MARKAYPTILRPCNILYQGCHSHLHILNASIWLSQGANRSTHRRVCSRSSSNGPGSLSHILSAASWPLIASLQLSISWFVIFIKSFVIRAVVLKYLFFLVPFIVRAELGTHQMQIEVRYFGASRSSVG